MKRVDEYKFVCADCTYEKIVRSRQTYRNNFETKPICYVREPAQCSS